MANWETIGVEVAVSLIRGVGDSDGGNLPSREDFQEAMQNERIGPVPWTS